MGKENFQRIMRIVVAFCPFALARAGHVQNLNLVRADKIGNQFRAGFR